MGPALSAQYAAVFGRPWPVWGAAILVATVNVFLFAFDRPWTASDGLRNWGDWVLRAWASSIDPISSRPGSTPARC